MKISNKNHTAALLLGIFLGWLGIHRFYAGKTGTAILWLLTVGLFGFGWFCDVILLLSNSFTDWDGALIMSERAQKRQREGGSGRSRFAAVVTWIAVVGCCACFALEVAAIVFNLVNPFGSPLPRSFVLNGIVGAVWCGAFAWLLSESAFD